MHPALVVLKTLATNKYVLSAVAGIAITAGAYLYRQHIYDGGYSAGQTFAEDVHREAQLKLKIERDAQIRQIEHDAQNAAQEARQKIAKTKARIKELLNEIEKLKSSIDSTIYDSNGTAVCTDVEVHLGNQFSDMWNNINKAEK